MKKKREKYIYVTCKKTLFKLINNLFAYKDIRNAHNVNGDRPVFHFHLYNCAEKNVRLHERF